MGQNAENTIKIILRGILVQIKNDLYSIKKVFSFFQKLLSCFFLQKIRIFLSLFPPNVSHISRSMIAIDVNFFFLDFPCHVEKISL